MPKVQWSFLLSTKKQVQALELPRNLFQLNEMLNIKWDKITVRTFNINFKRSKWINFNQEKQEMITITTVGQRC